MLLAVNGSVLDLWKVLTLILPGWCILLENSILLKHLLKGPRANPPPGRNKFPAGHQEIMKLASLNLKVSKY